MRTRCDALLSSPVLALVFQKTDEDLLRYCQELLDSGEVLGERAGIRPGVPFPVLPVDQYLGVFFDPST